MTFTQRSSHFSLPLLGVLLSLSFNLLCSFFGQNFITKASAEESFKEHFCVTKSQELEKLPIQQDGRVKPLYVHAQESLKYLTGKSSFHGFSAVETFCLLSYFGERAQQSLQLSTSLEHQDVRKLLSAAGSAQEPLKKIPLHQLALQQDLIRSEMMKQKENNSYKKELEKLISKNNLFQAMISGSNWLLPGPNASSSPEDWISFQQVRQMSGDNTSLLFEKISSMNNEYLSTHPQTKHLLELTFAKLHLFGFSIVVVLLALASFILFKNKKIGFLFAALSMLMQLAGVTFRVLISGRAPITNMYETVMFSGLGALILSMIIAYMRREKILLMVGLMYNLCTLLMLNFAHGMLNSSISPLVPVLRDNFWLSTHVTLVILSYAALALSWVLANMVVIRRHFPYFIEKNPMSESDFLYYNSLIYSCLKFGVIFLSAGVILGGVWADYSWGRFWGWDPKETWSLIVLLVYMVILHGKSTSWISPNRFVFFTAAAFMSVMMAWFGVNYILASGLHSYGFSQGGAVFLISFFTAQILVLLLATKKFFLAR